MWNLLPISCFHDLFFICQRQLSLTIGHLSFVAPLLISSFYYLSIVIKIKGILFGKFDKKKNNNNNNMRESIHFKKKKKKSATQIYLDFLEQVPPSYKHF